MLELIFYVALLLLIFFAIFYFVIYKLIYKTFIKSFTSITKYGKDYLQIMLIGLVPFVF